MMNMHTAFAVSELNDMSQHIYHHTVILFVLVHLIFKSAEQSFLLSVKQKDISDTLMYFKAVKRSSYIVGNTVVVRFLYVFVRYLG